MLICSTWTLKAVSKSTLPASYRIALSKFIHQQAGIEFGQDATPRTTFSGLLGRAQRADGFVTFYPEERYQISLSGLQADSAKKIAALALPTTIEFLGTQFEVITREDQKTSYEALYHQHVADQPAPKRQLSLSFVSPTAFSQQRTYLPLPVPTLLFRSWLDRWNHFSTIYLGDKELLTYIEQSVVLSRHRIQTSVFPIHNSTVNGFTGNIRLNILQRSDPLIAQVTNLLANYAQFSGTGIKTRLGMGKTVLTKFERT
mgnify:CR=1 FL=1